MRRIVIWIAAAALLLLPAAAAEEIVVEARDNVFVPAEITVGPRAEVVFPNTGRAPHTATAKDRRTFDTGNINPGETKSIRAPARQGTYDYVCIYHESLGMVGKVIVRVGGTGPASPAPAPASPPAAAAAPSPATPAAAAPAAPSPATPAASPAGGTVALGPEQRHLGPLVFAAIGILVAMAIAGASLAGERRR